MIHNGLFLGQKSSVTLIRPVTTYSQLKMGIAYPSSDHLTRHVVLCAFAIIPEPSTALYHFIHWSHWMELLWKKLTNRNSYKHSENH